MEGFLSEAPLLTKVALACLFGSLFGCVAPGTAGPGGLFDGGAGGTGFDSGFDERPATTGTATGTATGTGTGSTCQPGSLSSFAPVYKQPAGPYTGACTTAQLANFVRDCFASSTATKNKCDSWLADEVPCASCLAAPASSTSGAPLLIPENGATTVVDEGACIALADPASLMCAQVTEYAFQCELAACVTFCPISALADASTNVALTHCFGGAWEAGCSTYDISKYCQDSLEGGPATFCRAAAQDPNGNSEDLLRYLTLACGPPPPDAGSAARDGAVSDAGFPVEDGSPDGASEGGDDGAGDANSNDAARLK
jgi:hypothetical protein